MSTSKQVTSHKISITKSRSGHYTLTVREIGTWEMGGRVYPLNDLVFTEGKLELNEAQAKAAEFRATAA